MLVVAGGFFCFEAAAFYLADLVSDDVLAIVVEVIFAEIAGGFGIAKDNI